MMFLLCELCGIGVGGQPSALMLLGLGDDETAAQLEIRISSNLHLSEWSRAKNDESRTHHEGILQ